MVSLPAHGPSIFISYSHEDASFVRNVVRELKRASLPVSYDEVENLRVGDVLTERLHEAVDRHEYLAIVLSPTAVRSPWVQRELDWAMETEGSTAQVKVLPLIAEPCEVPAMLEHKVRLDFTTPMLRRIGIVSLVERLGGDTFESTGRLFPVLGGFAEEVQQGSVMKATIEAITRAEIPASVLDPYLAAMVAGANGSALVGLAQLCMRLADMSNCGYEAGEEAMRRPDFPEWGISTLSAESTSFLNPDAISWWHDLVVSVFRRDSIYNTLIGRHASIVMERQYELAARYLLSPDRGPAMYNVDSMLAAALATDRPSPFIARWLEWLTMGRFDGRDVEGDESPSIHYACLVDGLKAAPATMQPLVDASLERVRGLLKSGNDKEFDAAILHLAGMHQRRVPFADRVDTEVLSRAYSNELPVSRRNSGSIAAMGEAFRLLERYDNRTDAEAQHELFEARTRAVELAGLR